MFKLMPDSYYDVESPVVWWNVLAQFLVVDFFTYLNHRIVRFVFDLQRLTSAQSHIIAPLYKAVHKPHHKFTMPKQYNAFNGSVFDTVSLILIPLFITHQVCRYVHTDSSVKLDHNLRLFRSATCWDFIAFGTTYASIFTLIHSEYLHPWDHFFEALGIGMRT